MAKVFVHYNEDIESLDWINVDREYSQVPHVGEYVVISHQAEFLQVYLVVHCPIGTGYDAEIYAAPITKDQRYAAIRGPYPKL